MKDAKAILHEILSTRANANPKYSLRAFARDLKISPQQLSNVMTGRRGLSVTFASQICQILDLSEYEKEVFIESLRAQFSKSKAQRAVSKAKLETLNYTGVKNLEMELFKVISSWHHMALIELTKISKDQKNQITWFAKKCGISETEVQLSLGRLEKLDLLKSTNGRYYVNQDVVVADQGQSTQSVKKYHEQMLQKAQQALAFQTTDERYGSSSTLPTRVKNVERAKELIRKFRRDFEKEISDTEAGEDIFGLSIQFFKLTRPAEAVTEQ